MIRKALNFYYYCFCFSIQRDKGSFEISIMKACAKENARLISNTLTKEKDWNSVRLFDGKIEIRAKGKSIDICFGKGGFCTNI